MIPARPEATLSAPGHYPTLDKIRHRELDVGDKPGCQKVRIPIEEWAPLRSKDNLCAYGAIAAESKTLMAAQSGQCFHMINEVENRHYTHLQCIHKVRTG